jgi:hypothetical protein
MTSLGSLLWIVGIGALVYFMVQKGGGFGGGGHDKGHGSNGENSQGDDNKQPRGGCCG